MEQQDFTEKAHEALKRYFGYDCFRGQQLEVINHVMQKKDALVIMPTGGGKSICFQIPAILFEGVTIVISPLIALMKDQVDGLKANGVAAAFFNSSQPAEVQNQILTEVQNKQLKLLYVAPESLQYLQPVLKKELLSCVAVDEAHCISSWGPDFRPSYQQLDFIKKLLPQIPIIALTATADKPTREDILQQLHIPNGKTFLSSFDRPNIKLGVRVGQDKMKHIAQFLARNEEESGIIYCLSRKGTEQVAAKLTSLGFDAAAYHAGLSFEERNRIQENFVYDRLKVVCATVAFGMGIDKSNVRWVIHYNMPKNVEGYYQEIGRAGRDGLPSSALLFHSYADVIQLRQFTDGATNAEVQLAKLERMKQFAEATSCRRNVLLGYFGELKSEPCGNCDVCINPPTKIDGTVIAQKVLSTIHRTVQKAAMGAVIDVLRGAKNAQVYDHNFQHLKCYGIGKDVSWAHWQQYIIQLINQGLIELAFHEHNALKLTELSHGVLFKGVQVQLTAPQDKQSEPESKKQKTSKKSKTQAKGQLLFEHLRQVRAQIAKKQGVPAYLVFSDASLREMEKFMPVTEHDLLEISGVGQKKLENYGEYFIDAIRAFKGQKSAKKADTYKTTLAMYKEGKGIAQIAIERELNETTIYSHIAKLYLDGYINDLSDFVSGEEVERVRKTQEELNYATTLKLYFQEMNEELPYVKIRLALSVLEKQGVK